MTAKGMPGLARERHGMWRGGRTITRFGYVGILQPDHPRASNVGYVLEHILVAERALGHYLDERHPVHHVDENKQNNANTNLVVCEDAAYHNLLHRRMRAFLACGDANALRCRYCRQYDNQDDISVEKLKTGYASAHHRRCNSKHVCEMQRRRRARRKAERLAQSLAQPLADRPTERIA